MTRLAIVISAVLLGAGCTEPAALSPTPIPPTQPTVTVAEVTVSGPDTASGRVQLTATAVLSDGTRQDVTAVAGWDTSDSSIATVDPSGTLVPKGSGQVEARATYRTAVGVHTLLITGPPVPPKYVVSGLVHDSSPARLPLAGVWVRIIAGEEFGQYAVTDQVGVFRFNAVSAGRIIIEMTKPCYQTQTLDFVVPEVVERDVTMTATSSSDTGCSSIIP